MQLRTNWIGFRRMSLLGLVLIAGCGKNAGNDSLPTASIQSEPIEDAAENSLSSELGGPAVVDSSATSLPVAEPPANNPFPEVVIKTNLGSIRVKLNAEAAPQTVDNFLANYVARDFYAGTIFHYVNSKALAIAGGYTSDLQPKETRTPIRNEAHNGLKNVRGTIAMSRHGDYIDSATTQFFINLVDNPMLDYQESEDDSSYGYCVFGEIIEGLEVVDQIAASEVHTVGEFANVPVQAIVIESIERLD